MFLAVFNFLCFVYMVVCLDFIEFKEKRNCESSMIEKLIS